MKKLFLVLLAFVVAGVCTNCTNSEKVVDIWNGYDQINANNATSVLYAGNSINVGSVTYGTERVGNCGYFTATYNIKEGWEMEKAQLFVGRSEDMPVYDPKDSDSNLFPFEELITPRVTSFTQYIPCEKLPANKPGISFAARAVVRNHNGQEVTAFAGDDQELLTKL